MFLRVLKLVKLLRSIPAPFLSCWPTILPRMPTPGAFLIPVPSIPAMPPIDSKPPPIICERSLTRLNPTKPKGVVKAWLLIWFCHQVASATDESVVSSILVKKSLISEE